MIESRANKGLKMLTIEHYDVNEKVALGDLFDELGFPSQSAPTDVDGDSFIPCNWPIEVLSLDGYYPVEGLRWTKKERFIKLSLTDDVNLTCSPEHLIFQCNPHQWTKAGDLIQGDSIWTKGGLKHVTSIEKLDGVERLCDLQVAIAHSYFADDVLSHNSHFLTALGANALRNGVNVLHYTLELSETQTARRYDSNLCDIDSNELFDKKDEVLKKYQDIQGLGSLYVKQYPPNTATIYTLRSHVERCIMHGFMPGMMIIDYADILRSTRQYDSLRHELKLVYEELRGYADELKIPIWSASQSNKEGSTSEIVDLNNMSEAYGKAMTADVVISISRRSHEKANGSGRLYVAKNRAGKDGLVYPLKMNTARSQFELVGDCILPEQDVSSEENLRLRIKEKMNSLKGDLKLKDVGD